jgi:hypothetical protein
MLRMRFWVLVILLVPINALWVVTSEVIRYAGHPTTVSIFYNVLFWLCLLAGLNAPLRRFAPKLALTRYELLGLYAAMGLSSGLAGHDAAEVFLPIMAYPVQHATTANSWQDTLIPLLPSWLAVTDKNSVATFYAGHSSLYLPENYGPWLLPVFVWSGFMGVMVCVMLCLNVILRKRWTEQERLAFPIVLLPLEITDPQTKLWRNPLFWAGLGGAVVLQLWCGVAYLYPQFPMPPVKYAANPVDTNAWPQPWNAVGALPVGFYPFAIALGVLLPLELSFSAWVFFWFWKLQFVISRANAWDALPGFPYVEEQSLGGYLGVAISSLWMARKHLAHVVNHFLAPKDYPMDSSQEPISYRAAFAGLLVGSGMLFAFCRVLGMTPWVILAFFTIYFGIAVAITRMRAELGTPIHDLHYAGPDIMIPRIFGPTSIPDPDMRFFAFAWGFNRAYRTHPMPIAMEGFYLASKTNNPARPLFRVMVFLAFFAPLCAFWGLLHQCYRLGMANAGPPNALEIFASEAWNRYQTNVTVPQPPRYESGIAVVVGLSFSLVLSFCRARFMGFPLHPVGYAIASSWGMRVLWVPMLIAWGIKLLVVRYGGLGLYRKMLPLLYGVILGECLTGSSWNLVSLLTDIPTYGFWP